MLDLMHGLPTASLLRMAFQAKRVERALPRNTQVALSRSSPGRFDSPITVLKKVGDSEVSICNPGKIASGSAHGMKLEGLMGHNEHPGPCRKRRQSTELP